MFDYLQKFNTLPLNLRESVSSPAAMAVILELENKYKIDLAATVMKVMTKIIPLADLSIFFVSDFYLDQESAKKLTAELKERLFFPVANYLGYNASYSSVLPKTVLAPTPIKAPAETIVPAPAVPSSTFSAVDNIAKASGVSFASLDLTYRFKNILTTYLKGVRSRIDARLTLNKEIISGGLGLDHKTIDKIFKICDELQASQILPSGEELSLPSGSLVALPVGEEIAKSGLEKVRSLYEKPGSVRDIPYDLKSAIVNGEIKKPVAPLNLPVPSESQEKLLPEPKEEIKPVVAPVVIPEKKPEIKLAVPVPVIPTIPLAPIIKMAPIISAPIKAPIAIVSAALKTAPIIVSQIPKIIKPPEKKPSIFSGLFGAKKIISSTPTSTPRPAQIQVKNLESQTVPIIKPSVATLRNAAAQIKPVIKAPVMATPEARIVPRVMSPLDELRYLDLVNFRRFGTSPLESTAKVESKIKLLEKDGYDKMVSGVSAWRESTVNSLYLKMGQEALKAGLTFKQYATNTQTKETNNFLFWEEIEAIMALNGRLMF